MSQLGLQDLSKGRIFSGVLLGEVFAGGNGCWADILLIYKMMGDFVTVSIPKAHFEWYYSFFSVLHLFLHFSPLKGREKLQGKHFQGNKISTNRHWELLMKLQGITNPWLHNDGAHISMTNGRGWGQMEVSKGSYSTKYSSSVPQKTQKAGKLLIKTNINKITSDGWACGAPVCKQYREAEKQTF